MMDFLSSNRIEVSLYICASISYVLDNYIMVCLLVLHFENLLHVTLTSSLYMPLQLPLHLPLHVFVFGAFSCLCAFCVDFLMAILSAQLV